MVNYLNQNKIVYKYQFKDSKTQLPAGQISYHKKNFSRYFKLNKNKIPLQSVLETGCGPGTHAIILSLMGFKKVLAADLLNSNIQIAKKRKKFYKSHNLTFKQHDFSSNKSITNEKFDLISCHNWIQHTPNHQKIIVKLMDNLKIGGKIYISTYTAHTFRLYISSLARKIIHKEKFYKFERKILKYFPDKMKKYKSNQIVISNLTDDFFTPYIHTSTYSDLVMLGKQLGLKPYSKIPKFKNIYNIDTHQLKIGFIKKKIVKTSKLKNIFTKPYNEFNKTSNKYRNRCNILSKNIISILNKKRSEKLRIEIALKIYKIRAELHKNNKIYNRYIKLEKFLLKIYKELKINEKSR